MKTFVTSRECIPLLLFVLVAAMAAPTANSQQVMTPEHLALMKYVNEVAVSPDGNTFAYSLRVQRNPFMEDNGEAWLELHVADRSGQSRPYVTGEIKISDIDWTPDGKYISYLAERGEDTVKSLYIIPVDGGESKKITDNVITIKDYSWAPDSRRVAFLAKDPVPEETCELRKMGFDQEVYEEGLERVVGWIHDIQTRRTDPNGVTVSGSASRISWSPDGKLLAMAVVPTPLIDDDYMKRKVCIVSPDRTDPWQMFDNPGKLGQIAWSPDSKHLAIISGADINDPSAGEILVASYEDGTLSPVLTGIDGHVRDIAWLDKNTILYRMNTGVHTIIGTIRMDGSQQKTLVGPGRTAYEDVVLSDNGKTVAMTGSSFDHPWELYYFDVGKNNPTRLTDSNPDWAELRFARQEVVTYTARDGLELQGILIRPLDEVPGQKYPLILQVHGGPESNYMNRWMTWHAGPGQIAAARGFAVFYPNYRGSTGRGVEFSKMGQADYAGGEFNDLVDAVDHLVNTGLVDRDKVGITGWSYGGFATAWGATALSDHFAAAVMGAGVSDLVSKFGTTDIPNEMFLVHARRWPRDYWQWYMERSPIYHAQNHKTPILIIHGEDDTRVHPSQSMELYRYLKTLGQAPVRLVFYKEEPHGVAKAAGRYDISLRQLRWMEHYLKGPGGDPPPYEVDYSKLKPETKTTPEYEFRFKKATEIP
ncbi:MAG: S9 family peptidase [Candidatus Zixiibacteriota bacterium]|nr:MAG: S9 family peptidase [candidate division Zixibacteria bacterium]